jgi:hypothetical protein
MTYSFPLQHSYGYRARSSEGRVDRGVLYVVIRKLANTTPVVLHCMRVTFFCCQHGFEGSNVLDGLALKHFPAVVVLVLELQINGSYAAVTPIEYFTPRVQLLDACQRPPDACHQRELLANRRRFVEHNLSFAQKRMTARHFFLFPTLSQL